MVVEKVYEIWHDLEASYLKLGKGESKKDFLSRLIGLTSEGHKLDTIKSSVMKEYQGNEEKAEFLTNTFDSISLFLETNELPDIEDLNTFVANTITLKETSSVFVAGQIPADFFEGLNPFALDTSMKLPLDKHLESTGYVTDCYFVLGSEVTPHIIDVVGSEDIVVFNGNWSVSKFVERIQKKTPFLLNVYKVFLDCKEKGTLNKNMVFLNSNLFRVRGSRMTVDLPSGSYHFSLESKEEGYVVAVHEKNDVVTKVYGVL